MDGHDQGLALARRIQSLTVEALFDCAAITRRPVSYGLTEAWLPLLVARECRELAPLPEANEDELAKRDGGRWPRTATTRRIDLLLHQPGDDRQPPLALVEFKLWKVPTLSGDRTKLASILPPHATVPLRPAVLRGQVGEWLRAHAAAARLLGDDWLPELVVPGASAQGEPVLVGMQVMRREPAAAPEDGGFPRGFPKPSCATARRALHEPSRKALGELEVRLFGVLDRLATGHGAAKALPD